MFDILFPIIFDNAKQYWIIHEMIQLYLQYKECNKNEDPSIDSSAD